MADEQQPETPSIPEEIIEDNVFIVIQEQVLLDMIRQISTGADADFVYAEFWANNQVQQVIPHCDCDGCGCCDCDEEPDECECECSCEVGDESDEDGDE